MGERLGRQAIFLLTAEGVCVGGISEVGGEHGLGERNGWRREDGAEIAGIGLGRMGIAWMDDGLTKA